MSDIEIRPATASDIANIAQLLSATFYQYQGLRSLLTPLLRIGLCYDLAARLQLPSDRQYQCFVAETIHPSHPDLKILVGTVEVGIRSLAFANRFLPQKAYISNLAVQHNYRQQGIGHKLLQQCEDIARSWEQQEIFLHVRQDNSIAQSLYRKRGYAIPSPESPQRERLTSSLNRQRQLLQKILSA